MWNMNDLNNNILEYRKECCGRFNAKNGRKGTEWWNDHDEEV